MQPLLEIFLKLVHIESPSGHEDEIADYLQSLFKSSGYQVKTDTFGNIFIFVPGENPPLLLSAHIDTVEPARGIRAFEEHGIIKTDGKAILGADNKAAVAAIVDVVQRLGQKEQKHHALEVVFTRSEEVANLGAVNLDYSLLSAKEGFIADNPNPLGTIVTASPFYNRFDITVVGKSAHPSKPEEAINVVSIIRDSLCELHFGKVTDNTLVNIGFMHLGHVRNAIPGEAIIAGEVRSFVEKEVDSFSKAVVDSFDTVAKKLGGKITHEITRENPGFKFSKEDLLVKHAARIMSKVGLKTTYKDIWGCSDANIFIGHGIKVLNFGNGSKHTHTTSEQIAVTELERLSELLFSLVTSKV